MERRWYRLLLAHKLVSFAALTLIIVSSFAGSLFVSQVLPVHAAQPNSSLSYPQVVLGDSPISYWRLGETSGNVASDQTGNDNGTITGGVTLGQPGPVLGGGSFTFDGSTGWVDLGTNPNLQPQQWSIEAWFKSTTEFSSSNIIYRNRYNGQGLGISTSGQISALGVSAITIAMVLQAQLGIAI